MKVKELLEVTGGSTEIALFSCEHDKYNEVWCGIVDDIDFSNVPYGDREICHVSVAKGDDILGIVFE